MKSSMLDWLRGLMRSIDKSVQFFSKKINGIVAPHLNLVRFNFPTELEFEPIQLCNAKCFCCPYTNLSNSPEYTKKRMSREQIEHLLVSFHENLLKNNYHGPTTVNPFRYSDPLISPDLDFILDFASRSNLKIQITTNARGLNSRTIPILERNLKALKKNIFISVLGSSEEEIQKNMQISLEYTKKRICELSAQKSPLIPRILISLRKISNTAEESLRLEALKQDFMSWGVHAQIKSGWLHNRIEGLEIPQAPGHFVVACKLYRNKLLRRLEVMVNGDVVLCDDDAEGRRIFGNVFQQSIDKIWNGKLKDEHLQIYSTIYSDKKSNLLCANCSRASYARDYQLLDTVREIGVGNFLKQIKSKNYILLE